MLPIRHSSIALPSAYANSKLHISEPANSAVFFAAVQQAYQHAEKTTGPAIARDFLIHGHRLRVQFAGPALVDPCTLALDHLAVEPAGAFPELTIRAWDSASTQVMLPPCPWTQEQITAGGMVKGPANDSIQAALQVDIGALSLFDPFHRLALYRVANASTLPVHEHASPLKVILHWWLRGFDMPMIHCGAVGTAAGGALLVGHTGSGKSTCALACLNAGMRYVTDDRCVLSFANPEPNALCIYNSAKLWPDQMRRFPEIMGAVSNHSELESEKALVFVNRFAPAQLAMQLPIRVVLLAHIANHPQTTLTPATPVRVLRDLVPSTWIYQPGAAHEEMRAMAQLVRRVSCRQINLGSELERIPAVITRAIEDPTGPTGHISGL